MKEDRKKNDFIKGMIISGKHKEDEDNDYRVGWNSRSTAKKKSGTGRYDTYQEFLFLWGE